MFCNPSRENCHLVKLFKRSDENRNVLIQDVLFGVCLAAEDKHRKPLLCHGTTLTTMFCGMFYVCGGGNFVGKFTCVAVVVLWGILRVWRW